MSNIIYAIYHEDSNNIVNTFTTEYECVKEFLLNWNNGKYNWIGINLKYYLDTIFNSIYIKGDFKNETNNE